MKLQYYNNTIVPPWIRLYEENLAGTNCYSRAIPIHRIWYKLRWHIKIKVFNPILKQKPVLFSEVGYSTRLSPKDRVLHQIKPITPLPPLYRASKKDLDYFDARKLHREDIDHFDHRFRWGTDKIQLDDVS